MPFFFFHFNTKGPKENNTGKFMQHTDILPKSCRTDTEKIEYSYQRFRRYSLNGKFGNSKPLKEYFFHTMNNQTGTLIVTGRYPSGEQDQSVDSKGDQAL